MLLLIVSLSPILSFYVVQIMLSGPNLNYLAILWQFYLKGWFLVKIRTVLQKVQLVYVATYHTKVTSIF